MARKHNDSKQTQAWQENTSIASKHNKHGKQTYASKPNTTLASKHKHGKRT
jgi:hypothetical protein